MAANNDQNDPVAGSELLDFIHDSGHQSCDTTTQLAPEVEAITPRTLDEERLIESLDQYGQLVEAVYETIAPKVVDGHHVLWTRFLTYSEEQLQPIRDSSPFLAEVKPNLVDLFKVFQLIKNGVPDVRDARLHPKIVAACTDDDINDRLTAGYRRPGENEAAPNFVAVAFLRFIATIVDAVTHLHGKSRVLLEYVWHVDECTRLLEELQAAVREMLFNLRSRSETNRLAQQAIAQRCHVVTLLGKYVEMSNTDKMNNCKLFIDPFTTTTVVSTLLTVRTWIQNKTWYNNYNNIAEPYNISANTEVASINAKLEKLVPRIQQYTPSRYDIAMDTARNIKPSIVQTLNQFEFFQNAENKSLGQAKAQVRTLDGLRTTLQSLQGDGLPITDEVVGITILSLDHMYSEYTDFISQAEKAARVEEARQKVEAAEICKATASIKIKLGDFTDPDRYLDFLEQIQKYVEIQQSEMIRIQMIRPHLKIGNDFANTAGMTYQQLMSYLEVNYQKPNLIPQMVDRLLILPTPGDSLKKSLDNLNHFFSTRIKLARYESEYRIDRNVREKLVSNYWYENILYST